MDKKAYRNNLSVRLSVGDSYRITRIVKLQHAFDVAEVAGKL